MPSYKKECWSGADVLCPFFKKENREERSIRCEGFADGMIVQNNFRSLERWDRYMGAYCVKSYEQCPLYKCICKAKYDG